MKTNTFRTVLLYIKKEKLLKRKGRLVFREWFDLKSARLWKSLVERGDLYSKNGFGKQENEMSRKGRVELSKNIFLNRYEK